FLQELPLEVEIGHELLQLVILIPQHACLVRAGRAVLAILLAPAVKRRARHGQLPAHRHEWRAGSHVGDRLPYLVLIELARSHRSSVSRALAGGAPGAISRARRLSLQ